MIYQNIGKLLSNMRPIVFFAKTSLNRMELEEFVKSYQKV
jgi:hypothetical protein